MVGIDSAIQNSGDAFCAPPSLLHELFICPRPFPERSAGPARFKRGHQNGPPKRIGSRPSGLTCLNIARLKHSLYGRSSESGHNSRELSLIESRKYAFSRHKRISSDGNAILLWCHEPILSAARFFFLVSPVFLQRNRRNDDDSLLISSRVSTTIGPEKKTGEKEKEKEGDGGSR